jgi:hypothetical protein
MKSSSNTGKYDRAVNLTRFHPLKVPVHNIQSCFTACVIQSRESQLYTKAKAAVLLRFVLMKKALPFAAQDEPIALLEVSPV